MILSRQTFLYGKFEMVAKLPSARGAWSAFWLLPEARIWPPEIDIMEGMAWGPNNTKIHSGIIVPKEDKDENYNDWFDVGVNPSEGFHKYTLQWSEKTLTMLFDDKMLWTKPTPESMKQPMYMIINLAVGGKWPYNEVGIQPIDGIAPERLNKGADMIEPNYPAVMIVKSILVTK
jgi:beta-glucanase (GH16 family)